MIAINFNTEKMTTLEIIKEINAFSKYDGDVEAYEIVNELLNDVKWRMTANSFEELKKDLFTKYPLFYLQIN